MQVAQIGSKTHSCLTFQMANIASWAPTLAFVMGVVYMLGGLAKLLRQMGLVPMYVSTMVVVIVMLYRIRRLADEIKSLSVEIPGICASKS